eukprot:XP_024448995.1 homogentisate geranylgeranyltransferase, chloroplastic [Populus trichocarpa]
MSTFVMLWSCNKSSSSSAKTTRCFGEKRFWKRREVVSKAYGITSVSLLPVETISELSPTFFMGLLKALVPSVLMSIYVVGLNQLFDAEIDKSFAMGIMFQSPPHLAALLTSFVLGSVYSIELPLLGWKKQAFLAATCIMIMRAIVVQLAFFVHMQISSCFSDCLAKSTVLAEICSWQTNSCGQIIDVISAYFLQDATRKISALILVPLQIFCSFFHVFRLCANMLLIAYGAAVVLVVKGLLIL